MTLSPSFSVAPSRLLLIQTLVAFLPCRLLFQPARQQFVGSDASEQRSEPTTTNIGTVPVGTWKPISIVVQ